MRRFGAAVVLVGLLAGAAFADHHGESNVATCKRFYSEINKGNMKIVEELVSDDFVDHEEFEGLEPGKAGLRSFFMMMRAAFDDFRMEPEFFLEDGDKIAVYLTMSGTQKGEFMGMPSNGNTFEIKCIDIIRIKDGKAVEHWGVTDAMSMMQQLDAMMEEGEHDD